MNDPTRTPHIDPAWTEAFLFELRLLDVPGPAISAALADVESHCADAGESAGHAFGDPVACARALDAGERSPGISVGGAASIGAGVVGLVVSTYAAGAWATHEQVEVSAGLLAAPALLAGAVSLLVCRTEAVARAVVTRPWLLVVVNMVVVAATVSLLLGLDQTVLELPPLAVGAAGVALVTWHTVHAVRSRAAGTDRAVGPDGPGGVGSLQRGKRVQVLEALGPWTMAIATLVLGLLNLSLRLF